MPKTITLLLFCLALMGSGGMVLSPLLTDIAHSFTTSPATVGRAIAGYGAGTALTALWLGQSLDTIGVLRALRCALALGGAALIVAGFTTGWVGLSLAMFALGLASGVTLPASYAITSALSPKGEENRYMGRVLLGWSVALMAVVPLVAALADWLGWRTALQVYGATVLLMLGPLAAQPAVRLAASSTRKMPPFTPLTLPNGARIYGICLLWTISFFGIYTYLGDYSRSAFGISSTGAGLVAFAYGAGFALAVVGLGVIRKIGRKVAFSRVLLVAAALLAAMAAPRHYWLLLLLVGLWGLADHFLTNLLITGMAAIAPENRGTMMGLYSGTTYAGATVGTLAMGLQYEAFGFTGVALAVASLHLIALWLSRKL